MVDKTKDEVLYDCPTSVELDCKGKVTITKRGGRLPTMDEELENQYEHKKKSLMHFLYPKGK